MDRSRDVIPPRPRLPTGAFLLGAVALVLIGGIIFLTVAGVGSADGDSDAGPVGARPSTESLPQEPDRSSALPTATPMAAPAPSVPTAPPSPAPMTSAAIERAAISTMLRRHFADILHGNSSAAFEDLDPALGLSRTKWVSEVSQDGLYAFSLSVVPRLTSSTSALARILNFHTEALASGCKNWSGSWTLSKSHGHWLIAESDLSQRIVGCGG